MNAYIMTLDGQIKLLRAMENVTYGSVEHTKIVLFDDSWSDIPNLEPSWLYRQCLLDMLSAVIFSGKLRNVVCMLYV